jgi:hypothetical protein
VTAACVGIPCGCRRKPGRPLGEAGITASPAGRYDPDSNADATMIDSPPKLFVLERKVILHRCGCLQPFHERRVHSGSDLR